MATYRINTGYLAGILRQRDALAGHETVDAAVAALAYAGGHDLDEICTIETDDGLHVYWTEEDADRDADGSRAVAVIEREGSEQDTSGET